MWNQINIFHEKNFVCFSWKIFSFKLFLSWKICFWPCLKWQKMDFVQKKNSWNGFIWFHEFFGLDFFKFSGPLCPGWMQKIEKSQLQKNSWNQILNQFHEKIFWPKLIFCNFKNGQKSIFELGKSLKLNIFHENFWDFGQNKKLRESD